MKDKVVFKSDVFTDFTGKVRQVVFCAITKNVDFLDVKKELYLGVSVQNPADEVCDIELGKKIAEGKARKSKSRIGELYSSNSGMINTKVVGALLEQELEFFQQNPGVYLKGYNRDKKLFETSPEEYHKKFSK